MMKEILNGVSLKISKQDKLLISLIISIGTAICLLLVRVIYSRQLTLIFLIWNLFLAYIPFFLSRTMKSNLRLQKPGLLSLSIAVTWLIFFPNAPYILTDFFHLYQRDGVPIWLDLIIIAMFAWNGLIIGFLSLKDMQEMITSKYGKKYGWIFSTFVLASKLGLTMVFEVSIKSLLSTQNICLA